MNDENNIKNEDFLPEVSDMENSAAESSANEGLNYSAEASEIAEIKASIDRMNIIKKVLIALICLVVIGASVGFGYYMAKNSSAPDADGTTASSTEQVSDEFASDDENETDASDEDDDTDADTTSANVTQGGQTETSLSKAILGQWTDNANLSGYEFLEDGIMKVTYFNMSALNLEDIVDGTYKGTYTLEGNKLTISYTIYSKSITKTYEISVEDNNLYMKSPEGESVYVRKGSEPVAKTDIDEKLLGKWSSNLSGYEFKENGTVGITYINLSSMGINLDINGTVDGVYEIDGDKLNIKFSIYSSVIEKKYTYSIEGKTLTLVDRESGEKGTYIKEAE